MNISNKQFQNPPIVNNWKLIIALFCAYIGWHESGICDVGHELQRPSVEGKKSLLSSQFWLESQNSLDRIHPFVSFLSYYVHHSAVLPYIQHQVLIKQANLVTVTSLNNVWGLQCFNTIGFLCGQEWVVLEITLLG